MEVTALGIFSAILPGLSIAAMVWIVLQLFGRGQRLCWHSSWGSG